MKKIFLVEDDKAICEELEMLLRNSGYATDKSKRQFKYALKKHNISNKILLLLCFL